MKLGGPAKNSPPRALLPPKWAACKLNESDQALRRFLNFKKKRALLPPNWAACKPNESEHALRRFLNFKKNWA